MSRQNKAKQSNRIRQLSWSAAQRGKDVHLTAYCKARQGSAVGKVLGTMGIRTQMGTGRGFLQGLCGGVALRGAVNLQNLNSSPKLFQDLESGRPSIAVEQKAVTYAAYLSGERTPTWLTKSCRR